MSQTRPVTILCLSSFLKGQEFIRECKRQGCRVLLITVEKLRDADWPRESIDEVFYMPDLYRRDDVIHGVSYLARTERIERIVPLDEFDLEMASTLREHLRVPGMGETTVRYFRDKLAMRMKAREEGILVPDFVPILHNDAIREYLDTVPPPWVLKPRTSASAIGIRKLDDPDEVWRVIEGMGDRRSFHLLERFVRGEVYHVDSLAWEREIVFAEANGYMNPPFEVYHGGGLFCTRTIPRASDLSRDLRELDERVMRALGMVRGALHTEFIRGEEDGRLYFLETAARVGGANIADMVEAATGLNPWREWARLEVASARGEEYHVPEARDDSAGLLISLARQEWPDTSAYDDPEIVWRLHKRHHAGLLVASPSQERVEELLRSYMGRFREDFYASMPAAESATD
ncbi:MAG TPA: ATP-grasp domain-containing protein [Longimicrobiaceae bacterium]|nr:ATP-grasp domain-containing protein [Longimicrobiaceae bacterium]